ncbi:hypothetical protein BO71DRAFT_356046 [Aspergillus ellipticus CBS 707.79]|uniref:MFS general substrate transporter n=1 Tax=Aspergillus ellipticus CBS 707.79 TaxID=1448320 RepID=A0A319D6M1_9EURO|nr:hypothetical protein BO71DRAFT_356046 [Aspergillus ellipticus CBS 707.79]
MVLTAYRLLGSTCGFAGLQVIWAVYFAYGTAHLLSIGFNKSSIALILMAGPICGVVVQPYMGGLSDNSRFRWGRRRPFIVSGVIGIVLSLNAFANLASPQLLQKRFQIKPETAETTVKIIAVMLVYILNISCQPVQNGLRALMVEAHSARDQTRVNVWTSYMTAAGNIAGYCMGTGLIINSLSWLEMTQFPSLCLLASAFLTLATTVTCLCTAEAENLQDADPHPVGRSLLGPLKHVLREVKTLSHPIRRVFRVQFLAWLGWFPFLYYQSLYVNELYSRDAVATTTGAAIGSLTGLFYAITSLVTSIAVSIYLSPPPIPGNETDMSPKHLPEITRIWRLSQFFFAAAMFSTVFIAEWLEAAALVALIGIPWSISSIAPYTLLSAEISTRRDLEREGGTAEVDNFSCMQAGTVMSIHNVAISAPQIIAAGLSSGVFWVCRFLEVEENTVWVLGLGGFASLGAGVMLF